MNIKTQKLNKRYSKNLPTHRNAIFLRMGNNKDSLKHESEIVIKSIAEPSAERRALKSDGAL